jgi:glycerophosphoryl diester phosphodiesterase
MVTHYIHRGLAKKNLKENTLSAFKYSFKKKYGIETDLQVTKDNQLICFHDFNLRRKFNLNKNVKDINYSTLKKISKKRKATVPLLKDLLKISKNRYPLLLEIKPLLAKHSLLNLIKLVKKTKKYGIFSFKEKNLINLYKLNKKLNLGLLFLSTSNLRTIKSKSKKHHVKFLGLEKSFLSNKKLTKIRKPIFYYTIKRKDIFKKYKNSKNLIFENS